MAWVDDRLWCHPKVVNLSDRAFRAHVNAIAYSSGFSTGGWLTVQQQQLIGASAKERRELLAAGLWEQVAHDVIAIHDWDEHNGKRDERRKADRERKRASRSYGTSAGQSAGTSTGQSAGRSTGTSPGTAHVEGSEGSDCKAVNSLGLALVKTMP